MELRKKEVPLGGGEEGKVITVSEAGWDYSFRFGDLEKELKPLLSDPNYNKTFKFFLENFYQLMASCSEGDVPSPQEAFVLPRLYLDNWYLAFWELNEDIVGEPCIKEMHHEEVKFRDGSSVTVWESHGLPSFTLKLVEMEFQASDHPLENDPQGQMFVSLFYPKLAASCNGSENVPDALTVRSWPRSEIQKWMDASRRWNPQWYVLSEEQQKEDALQKRKKPRRRSGG